MKRVGWIILCTVGIGFAISCTESDGAAGDAGIDASVDDTDAGGEPDEGDGTKKCLDIGPLHKCVGWDDCPVYNMRAFTCPNPLFVCCVDWTPPFADGGTDGGS